MKNAAFCVKLLELRKYYNIQMECKNKCETFQVGHHFIGAAQHITESKADFYFYFIFLRPFVHGLQCGNRLLWRRKKKNKKKTHQNAKRNYIYANALRCRVNYQSAAGD